MSSKKTDAPSSEHLDRIAADHREVRDAMHELQSVIGGLGTESRREDWKDLEHLLRPFRALLSEHFALEEREELFGSAALVDPFTRGRLDQLILQHRSFLKQLDGMLTLLEQEERSERQLSSLLGELDNLMCNIRWHDAVETRLLKAHAPG